MLVASQNSPEGIADTVVIEQKGELDQKKLEIENEVQRVREMMLKIQGKTDSNHKKIPDMPKISGKSAASQSFIRQAEQPKPESPSKRRDEVSREERTEEKKKVSKEKDKHHRERSRSKKPLKRRSISTSRSRSSSDRRKAKKHKKHSKKERSKRSAEGSEERKDRKKEKASKSKKKRKVSVSSSYERRESSSLSSD